MLLTSSVMTRTDIIVWFVVHVQVITLSILTDTDVRDSEW